MNGTTPAALSPYEGVLNQAKTEIAAINGNRDYSDEYKTKKVNEIQQRADTQAAQLAEADIKQATRGVELAREAFQAARIEARLSMNYLAQMLANDIVRTKATYAREVAAIDAELAEAIDSVDVETINAWQLVGLPILLGKAHEYGARSDWAERYPIWAQRMREAATAIEPEALTKAREGLATALAKQETTRRAISSAAHYSGANGYGSHGPLSKVAASLPGAQRQPFGNGNAVVMPANYLGQWGGKA